MIGFLIGFKMDEKIKVRLIEIIKNTDTMKTFRFTPVQGSIPEFLPGQFVFLYANINGEEIKRAYSIASSPLDNTLDLGLELVENGKMTTYFHNNVKIGDIFEISQPKGHFKYTDDVKKAVMIAGGSGITPMRAISRYCTQKKLDTKLILLYSSKTEDKILYRKEFEELAQINPNLKVVHTLTRNKDSNWKGRQGRVCEEVISEECGNLEDATFYLCGSINMVKTMSSLIKEMGADRKKIKMDIWGT